MLDAGEHGGFSGGAGLIDNLQALNWRRTGVFGASVDTARVDGAGADTLRTSASDTDARSLPRLRCKRAGAHAGMSPRPLPPPLQSKPACREGGSCSYMQTLVELILLTAECSSAFGCAPNSLVPASFAEKRESRALEVGTYSRALWFRRASWKH